MNCQIDGLAAHGGELIRVDIIIASAERKEIGRLLVRIIPYRKVTTIIHIACLARRTVRQQDGIGRLVGRHAHGEAAHHIRTVGIKRNATESDGFALGAETVA